MRFSPKSELLIGNFHQNFDFLVKPYFLFFQYRKSVLKKTQIFGPLFEPCSSCVAVDFFPEKQKTISGKQRPPKRVIFRQFLSKCPNVIFFCPSVPIWLASRQLGAVPPPPSPPPPLPCDQGQGT